MSKINHKKEYGLLAKKTEAYALLIRRILDSVVAEVSSSVLAEGYDGSEWFSFDRFPETKKLFEQLQKKSAREMRTVIVNGITASWTDSNFKNDRLAKEILGKKANFDEYSRYFDNHEAALSSFIKRQRNGLNLSKRVWKLEDDFKSDLEKAISVGIGGGKSADELSRDIREYLNEPQKLFRRLRTFDVDGNFKGWKLSNPALSYTPGTGQYRSSYKNAMRLARTEINMAYRTADQERWSDFDFVVGYEVKRSQSNQFACERCAALTGKYPKSFVFTGWHPLCKCYIIPILKTDAELDRDDELIMQGLDPSDESVNTVADVPAGFKNYVRDHSDSISGAAERGTLPYFLRDNDYKQYLEPDGKHPFAISKALAARYKEQAEKLGVENASFEQADDAEFAGNVNDWLAELNARKLEVPKLITFDAKQFPGDDLSVALYNHGDGGIHLNPRYTAAEIKEMTKYSRLIKYSSSASEHHILYHEYAHWLHAKANSDIFDNFAKEQFTTDEILLIRRSVSQRAGVDVYEFVAEVVAGQLNGMRYGQDVLKLFNRFKGKL